MTKSSQSRAPYSKAKTPAKKAAKPAVNAKASTPAKKAYKKWAEHRILRSDHE